MDRDTKMQDLLSRLESNPYDLAPVKRMESIYDSEPEVLVERLVAFVEEHEDEDVIARCLLEAGRLAAIELEDADTATMLIDQCLEVGEETLVSVEAHLYRLAIQGEGENLLGFFTDALGHFEEEQHQSRLYMRMGDILWHLLGNTDEARNAFQYAVDLEPSSLAARWSQQDLERKREEWERLAELLYEEVEHVDDPEEQSRASAELGEVYLQRLDDSESALQCFGFAYELDPNNERAREGLSELGHEVEGEESAEEAVGEDVELEDLATDDVEGGVEAPAEELTATEPDPHTMELDDDMLLDEEDAGEPPEAPGDEESEAEALDDDELEMIEEEPPAGPPSAPPTTPPEAEAAVDADEEVDLDVEQDEETFEAGEDVSEVEAELEEESVDLDEDISDAEEVMEVDEDEDDLDEFDEAIDDFGDEEEVEDAEDADDVEEAAEEAEELEEDDEEVADLEDEGEEVEDFEDVEDAEEVDEAEEAEEADEAEEPEEEPYTWRDRLEDLREQAASAGSDDDQLMYLTRAARLESRHREDDEDALALWSDAIDLGVGLRFYRRAGYLVEEESFWQSVLDLVDGSGTQDEDALKARLAFQELGDHDQAAEWAEAAGDEDMLTLLEDLEQAQDNWRKFQRALEKRHDDLGEEEKAMTVYLQMANMAAALGDLDKEIDALRRLDRQVDDELVTNRLKVLYRRAEKWPMYVDLIKKEVEALGDERDADRVDLLHEAIRVYRDEMNHDMMVVNTYKEILEIEEDNLEAIDALIEMYDKMNRASELINMLQTKAEHVRTEDARVEIHEQIAELFLEKFRNQAEAIKAYEQILEIRPYHKGALSFLKEMYEKRREWEKLIDVHKQEIETLETEEEKAAALKEVAELASDRLRNPEVATELWLEVREVAPGDMDALDALEKLYEKSRDYEKLAEVLEQKVEQIDDADAQMKLYQKMGMLYADRLEDTDSAIDAWKGALELDWEDLKARKALEKLYIQEHDWDALEEFYAKDDAYQDLVRVMETRAGTVEDPVKIELLLRAARIWREELEDTGRAERDLERVLSVDERNEQAARQLAPIYREKEDWEKLQESLRVILEHQEETEDRREYQLKLASLHANELEDPQGAFEWYAQAYRETPNDEELAQQLRDAAGAAEAWGPLADVYRDTLQMELDEEAELTVRLQLGQVLSEQLDQLDPALEQFQAVLDVQPDHLDALASMEKIYRRAERWDDLQDVYQRRLDLTDDASAKVEILRGMADIAEEQAGDVDQALEYYERARDIEPANPETLAELHRLYRDRAAYDQLADTIRGEIEIIEQRARERAVSGRLVGAVDVQTMLPGEGATLDAESDVAGFDAELEEGEAGLGDEFSSEVGLGEESSSDVGLGEESSSDVGLGEESSSEVGLGEESSSDVGLEEDTGEDAEFDEDEEEFGEEEELDAEESEAEDFEADEDEDVEETLDEQSVADTVEDGQTVAADVGPQYLEDEIEELVALRHELGEVCKHHLDEHEEAIGALGLVLTWRPLHDDALAEIETYLEDPGYRGAVARTLEPIFEVRGQWARLIDTLEIQVDVADATDEQVSLLERIGDVQVVEQGAAEDAFETYKRLVGMEPSSDLGRRQIKRVANETGQWAELIEHYESIMAGLDDESLRVDYLFDLAEMYSERLEDSEQAQELYNEILEVESESNRALDALEGLYSQTEQWDELLDVYEKKIDLAETTERAQEYEFRKAVLHERLLDDPETAISVLKGIFEDDPENVRAIRGLNRLYRDAEDWDALADNLRTELELVEGEETNDVKNRLGRVYEFNIEDLDRAVDYYEEVLDASADDERANAALERLMHREDAPRRRASEILEPLYVERDEWERLIDALEVQVDTSTDPEETVALLHRIAELHEERGGDERSAFDTYARALSHDVENETTLDALYRLAESLDDYSALEEVFDVEAAAQGGALVKKDLYWRAAEINIEHLDRLDAAAEQLEEVRDRFPDDLETVEALEAIYQQTQTWEPLVTILRAKSELVEEEENKKQLLYQAGNVHEEILERPEAAVDVYQQVLTVDEADSHAIDRLEVIYTDLARWEDLLEIYRRKLDLAENDEARKDLLYAMGPIYREHLDAPFDAIEVYNEILEIDDAELAALEKLDELYQETEQWNELLETLQREMELAGLPEDRLFLKYRTGRLWETEMADGMQAIEVYQEVLDEAPEHEETREALEGMVERGEYEVQAAEVLQPVYEEANEWEKLVRVYELLIEASPDPERKLELYNEVARIWEEELGDKSKSFDAWVSAAEVMPGREEVLENLERLARELDQWHHLIDELDRVLEDVSDYGAVTEINLRIARIYEEELGLPAEAIERHRRVTDIEPDNERAILALDRLYQTEGRWHDLAEIVQTRIMNSTEPDETRELQLRQGMLYQEALEEPDQAIDVYQTVLMDAPDNEQAIQSLEQMFMAGQAVQRISDILEPHYLEKGQHEKLVEIYLQRLEMLDDRHERYDLLMQVGRILLNELGDEQRALEVYGNALAEKPDDDEVVAKLEELAESTGSWEPTASFYVDALEREDIADEDALELWVNLANILDDKLQSPDDAEGAYLQALEIDEGEPRALEALDRIYESQGRYADLADILRRRIQGLYDEDDIVELSYRLAQVYQNELDMPEDAIDTYRNILDIRPAHENALEMLEQLHTQRQEWQDLFDILERRAENTMEPDEQAEFYARMANLAENMLERPMDAIDLWNRVLDIDPADQNALDNLRELYFQTERWDDLVSILERQVELSDNPDEQLVLYDSLGTIWSEQLGNDMQAMDAWQAVLEIDPMHLEALESVRDIYTQQGDYEQLADVLERMIDHEMVEQERKQGLWTELAEIQGDMLMRPHEAIEAWRNVMSMDPGNELALENLERLYLQESMWEEAAGVLDVKVDNLDDEQARIDELMRIADIYENKLMQPEEAARQYERVLDIEPTNMQASRSLENIYRELGDEEALSKLVNLYLDRAEVVEDPYDRADILRAAARVFEESLQQPESALLVMLSAFTPETVDDEELRRRLEELARQTGLWDELVERFAGVLQELGDSFIAADLHKQVGGWYANELDQPDDAVMHLQRALGIEPDNEEILEMLEGLYRQLASWPELANVLNKRIELSAEPDERIDLWRKLGELYEMQMAEIDDAVEAYEQILAIDETDLLAMESLERIFEAYERWEDLIDVLRRKAESTYDPDEIVGIKERIATIYEERLEQPHEAIDAYREVLAVDQSHAPSLEALERLYMMTERWEDLLDVYDQQLSMTHEPEAQVVVYGKMATVHEDQFEDLESAVQAYDNVLTVAPEHETALENLERLYETLERWFDLVDTLRRHVDVVENDDRKVELLNRLGRVQRDQVDDPHAAVEALAQSLDISPNQLDVARELADLYEQTDNFESAVEALQKVVALSEDEDEKADVYHRIGRIYEQDLLNDERAEQAYLNALEIQPTREDTIEQMRGLYERTLDWQGLIQVLKRAEDASRDLELKAKYLAEIGRTYDDEMDDRVSALNYYEQALETDPQVIEAAEPLIDVYVHEQRWERAVPLLEMVLEQYDEHNADPDRVQQRELQSARVYDELAQNDEALEHYKAAYEIDPTDLETLRGFGNLLYEQEEYERASNVYENLEYQHLDKLDQDEMVEVYYRSGVIRQRFGEHRNAIEYFNKALSIDGYHQQSLERLIDIHEERGDWEDVVEFTRRLLESEEEDARRFTLLTKMGDLLTNKIGDRNRAVQTYVEALDIEPNSVAVLRKLLDLYTKTQQWMDAVEILHRLIEQEENDSRIAKYNYTVGVIYRDEIGSPLEAVDYFDAALDHDVKMLKAFEAIDRIMTQAKEWKELERAYRRMLRRVSESPEGDMENIKVLLWSNLGEIYRSRLGHVKSAIGAYEAAVGLKPDDQKFRLILAELYEKKKGDPEGAINQHKELIKLDPFRIESYRALFKAYIQMKEYDKAWCMSSALSFLQSASETEQNYYEKYAGQNLRAAKGQFKQETYQQLYHSDEELIISFIMSILGQGLRDFYYQPVKNVWGVHKRKDVLDIDQQQPFCNVYRYVARTMAQVPAPKVYLKKDQALGIRNANAESPAVIIGPDMMQGKSDRELAFHIGKRLCWMRPEHYLGSVGYPTEFLKVLFMATMHITDPSLGIGQTLGEQGEQVIKELQGMPAQMLMQLQKYMKQYLATGKNPNLSAWLTAVEHTCIRSGLVLCGNLHEAASAVKNDTNPIGKATVKEKIRELVLFSISDEYFDIRQKLGIAIG